MTPFTYQLQLVGGPDDGATFRTSELPPYWDMLKGSEQLACNLLGVDESLVTVRYWRSNRITESGMVLYFHEELYDNAVRA